VSAAEVARELAAVRAGAGLFRLPGRGVLEVAGADRVRWLDGMITADVKSLATGAGAPGLLLTRQGRVVADLHVLARADELWLELEADALPTVSAQLSRYIVADDVALVERRSELVRLALEGPRAAALLGDAAELAPHAWREARIAGAPVVVAAWGFTGLPGLQLFAPAGEAEAVAAALVGAGATSASADTFECLRIAAGVPWLGRELDESVLPAEARLEAAISTTKGCYTGQEVVTRMRSRGRVGHLLVGLRFEGEALPARGAAIEGEAGAIGQVTSSVRSPEAGPIGLGFVRAEFAAPGAVVRVAGAPARIAELPL
jgi:folate-binding protein YgfZ